MMNWHGKSVALFAVTISMLALPLIVVPLRCYVRLSRRSFKLDDWLIVAALLFHMGACAVTLWGFTYGLAMPDKYLTADDKMKAVQTFAMYKPLYTLATCLTKNSICYTSLRVASSPKIRKALHWILIAVTGSGSVMLVGSFVYCDPYPAIWTHWQHPGTPGYCLPGAVVLTVGYAFACITIITDLCCAVIPGIILWNTIMSTRNMCLAWLMLGCGVLAGIMTACRLPYIMAWTAKHNQSYGLGRILLFEILECGLGIFASCAPALKPLLHASISSVSSFLNRLTHWTTLGSSNSSHHHHHNNQEKAAEEGTSQLPSRAPAAAVPKMDLVIPDIEDTVLDTRRDTAVDITKNEDDDEEGRVMQPPVIIVWKDRSSSGHYTDTWDVSRDD